MYYPRNIGLVDYLLCRGYDIEAAPPDEIIVSPGVAVDDTNMESLLAKQELTLDISTNGVNGLDTGSPSDDTWYYIWVIGETSEAQGLISLSSSNPILPAGYTRKRRIGSARYDTGTFLDFCTEGDRTRAIRYREDIVTRLTALTGGTAGAYSDIDCSALVPPTTTKICGYFRHAGTGVAYFRPKGLTPTLVALASTDSVVEKIPNGTNEQIQYRVTDGEASLYILGYTENT